MAIGNFIGVNTSGSHSYTIADDGSGPPGLPNTLVETVTITYAVPPDSNAMNANETVTVATPAFALVAQGAAGIASLTINGATMVADSGDIAGPPGTIHYGESSGMVILQATTPLATLPIAAGNPVGGTGWFVTDTTALGIARISGEGAGQSRLAVNYGAAFPGR